MPDIKDDRIVFIKGWFDQTLPTYSTPEHEQLILNLDADLYSSTILVLRHFRDVIRRGTYIYFERNLRSAPSRPFIKSTYVH